MRRMMAGFAGLAVLAACEMPVAGGDDPDACGASRYAGLVGQDRAAVAAAGLQPGPKVRIIGPDDMITMDLRMDRLNVELDRAGKVVRVRCG